MHFALPLLVQIIGSYMRLAVGWFIRFVYCSPIGTVSVGETHMPPNATFTLPVLDIAVLVASSTDVFGIKVIVLESVKRTWLEFVTVRTPEKGSSRVFRMIFITHRNIPLSFLLVRRGHYRNTRVPACFSFELEWMWK